MMKIRNYLSIFVFSLIASVFITTVVNAGYLLYEDFAYPDGHELEGWTMDGAYIEDEMLYAPNARNIFYDLEEFGTNISISVDLYADRDSFGNTTWAGLFFARDDDRDTEAEGPTLYQSSIYRGQEFTIGHNNFYWSGHRTRDSSPDFQTRTWYTIEVDYDVDGTIEARLFERDSGELLSTRNHSGVPLSGKFGLSASENTWIYDNLTIIPEPSTLALLGLGGLMLLKRRRI